MTLVGDSVQQRRMDLGLTVEDAASFASLTPVDLRAIEQGGPVTWGKLVQVARALATDPEVLLGKANPDRLRVRCRTPDGTTISLNGHDARTMALAARTSRAVYGLATELKLDFPINSVRHPKAVERQSPPWKQGYELGPLARQLLSLDVAPMPSVQSVLESLAVHVGFVELSSGNIDAISIVDAEMLPVVLVNRRSPRAFSPISRRSVLAHELCHLLFDTGVDVQNLVHASFQDWNIDVEQRARAFAPAFLAPPGECSAPTGLDPLRLVHHLMNVWGLTGEGATWHARNIGLLSPAEAERLVRVAASLPVNAEFEREVARKEIASEMETTIEPLVRGLFSDIVLQAVDEDVITPARAREILRGQA